MLCFERMVLESRMKIRVDSEEEKTRETEISDKDGKLVRDISLSQGLLQSVTEEAPADFTLQTEEAPQRAKRLSPTFPSLNEIRENSNKTEQKTKVPPGSRKFSRRLLSCKVHSLSSLSLSPPPPSLSLSFSLSLSLSFSLSLSLSLSLSPEKTLLK